VYSDLSPLPQLRDSHSGHATPQEPTLDPTQTTTPRRHEISFLRNGHSWRLQWQSGDEALLVETVASLATDPDCPLDAFDQALVQHHLDTTPQ